MHRMLLSTNRLDGPRDPIERELFDGVAGDVRAVGRSAGVYGILGYLNSRVRFQFTGMGTTGPGEPLHRVFDRDYPAAPLSVDTRFLQLLAGGNSDVQSTMWAPVTTSRGSVEAVMCHFDVRLRLASVQELRVFRFVGDELTTLASEELANEHQALGAMMRGMKSPSSLELANAILATDASEADAASAAMAMQQACTRVTDNLRQAIGNDGCNALLIRVMRTTAASHPLLGEVWCTGGEPRFHGVRWGVESHGLAAVTTALETGLAALIDLIARLVGSDMVPRLLEVATPRRG